MEIKGAAMKPKNVTLAQLRKLAKQKGYTYIKVFKLPPDGDKRTFFFTTASMLGGSTTIDITSGHKAEVVGLLFAALSALPDADPKRSKR